MAKVTLPTKPLTVNPLKVSQPMGASLAFLGLANCMPLEHGARGCTSFNKLFFMRHFREPIALQTTAMDQVTTVIGADENVVEALQTIVEKNAPDIIGLITTGLSETQGADIPRTVKEFRRACPEYQSTPVVTVGATDTMGCLESGFALAVEGIVADLIPPSQKAGTRPTQVNVLPSAMLTTGDLDAIREWIEAFGLTAVILPDLSDSLDGHLIEEGYSTLTYGGTTWADIVNMGESAATLVIGPSLYAAADALQNRTGVPVHRFAGLMGVAECDAFTEVLSLISGHPVPARVDRWRDQMLDAMVDCNFQLNGSRIALAADPDHVGMLARFLTSVGIEVITPIASAKAESLHLLDIPQVIVGDLEDLEHLVRDAQADLIIANSHAAELAARLDVPLMRAGFPLYDVVGAYARTWVGYRGCRHILFDLANILASQREEIAPYRSIYWQGTDRDTEVTRAVAPKAHVY